MRRRDGTSRLSLGLGAFWLLAGAGARGQEPVESAPDYPRVNLSVSYEVAPDWPQKPADAAWGQMPGVAVDGQDHVWIFTRAEPPVQVYDADGRFVRAWGRGLVKKGHHLKIDGEGHIWLADVGDHVVTQFTPEGAPLRTLGTRGVPGAEVRAARVGAACAGPGRVCSVGGLSQPDPSGGRGVDTAPTRKPRPRLERLQQFQHVGIVEFFKRRTGAALT